jgi:hypothetical protein
MSGKGLKGSKSVSGNGRNFMLHQTEITNCNVLRKRLFHERKLQTVSILSNVLPILTDFANSAAVHYCTKKCVQISTIFVFEFKEPSLIFYDKNYRNIQGVS